MQPALCHIRNITHIRNTDADTQSVKQHNGGTKLWKEKKKKKHTSDLIRAWHRNTGPEVKKLFSCSTQLSMKFVLLINLKLLTNANSFLLNVAKHENSLLINMKMPTIVRIFIFISRENFMCSWVEHEKSFISSGPDLAGTYLIHSCKR